MTPLTQDQIDTLNNQLFIALAKISDVKKRTLKYSKEEFVSGVTLRSITQQLEDLRALLDVVYSRF